LLTVVLVAFTGCRRDLWVYTDDYRQVELVTDWSEAHEVPGGMTWWFMDDGLTGTNRHGTTAEVTHTWLNLPRGQYTGVVFDYSPAEYSHQRFVGMDKPSTALVQLNPSADQPAADDHLYGDQAVTGSMEDMERNEATGMFVVAAEPELMNADTLKHVTIVTGIDEERVLYEDRDKYSNANLTIQTLYAQPKPIVWELQVRVRVKGIKYMGSVTGSVAGLTDGCWLAPLRHTSTPCLQRLDSWRSGMVNDSIGYISTTINTFGLTDIDMPSSDGVLEPYMLREAPAATRSDVIITEADYDQHLRLNLRFLLRDNLTVLYYHYNVGPEAISVYEDRLVVNIDIDYPFDIPDLPYVDEAGTAGFDATVSPWEDGGTADETM
jgi:hypothetical protein